MKKNLLCIVILITGSIAFSHGQTTLTQNTDDIIIDGNSVACPSGDNFWGRAFTLTDFGINDTFYITSGEIGVQSISGQSTSTVTIYTLDNGDPSTGTFTQLGTQTVTIPAGSDLQIVSYTFDTPVEVPSGTDVVFVEVFHENGPSVQFFIGGTAGQTEEPWLKSMTCQIEDYTTPANVGDGFPDANFYITVTGDDTLTVSDEVLASLSIYPNPTTDILKIQLPAGVALQSTSIYDMRGSVVEVAVGEDNSVDVSHLSQGMYLIEIGTDHGSVKKIVMKK